jgi:N-acetylglucosamine repressor
VTLVQNPRQLTVLRLIRRYGPITRAQIGLRAKLSASQVSRLTSELIERELIETERAPAVSRNRPADRLTLATGKFATIGLDVGGVAQQAVVANLRGETVASVQENHNLSVRREDLIDYLQGLIRRVLDQSCVPDEQVLGLGVAFRAIVDPAAGVITRGPESPFWTNSWTNLAVRDLLAQRFTWNRIAVDDTVRVLGLAEARFGLGARESDFVYVLADTGIGAALMINAKSYIGPSRISGEIGHLTIDPLGPVCACGKRGCIETYASSQAMLECANRERPGIAATIGELDVLAREGDAPAVQILTDAGSVFGQGLAALLNILGPKLVVVSGVSAVSDIFLNAAWQSAKSGAVEQAGRDVRLVPSRLGPFAGAAGSAAMILDQLFEGR